MNGDGRLTELACDVHGPLKPRPGDAGNGYTGTIWVCLGWDGEGCPSNGWPVPDEAYQRVNAGITRWPGAVRVPLPQKEQEDP